MRAIERSSHPDYRSLLALTSTAYTRSCQSARHLPLAPIKTQERFSRLGDQMRTLGAQPRVTTEHARNIVNTAALSEYNLLVSLNCLWPLCHFDLGDQDAAGGCS